MVTRFYINMTSLDHSVIHPLLKMCVLRNIPKFDFNSVKKCDIQMQKRDETNLATECKSVNDSSNSESPDYMQNLKRNMSRHDETI